MGKTGNLIDFEIYIEEQGVMLFDCRISGFKAASIENNLGDGIFIDRRQIPSENERRCVLAHEMGHLMTGATHRLSSPLDLIAQHEYKANAWAFKNLMPLGEVMYAAACGVRSVWDLAEYFSVPEDFAAAAYAYYLHNAAFADFIAHLRGKEEA